VQGALGRGDRAVALLHGRWELVTTVRNGCAGLDLRAKLSRNAGGRTLHGPAHVTPEVVNTCNFLPCSPSPRP
jgi:hypothetical protein